MKNNKKYVFTIACCLFLTWCGAAKGNIFTDTNLTREEPSCFQSFTPISSSEELHQESPIGAKTATISLPPKTNEMQKLRNVGFNLAYVRGSDEVNEWIAVSAQMREQGLSASEHHIGYLADKIRGHIQFMKEGAETTEEREKLERLTSHIEKTINAGRFTYEEYLRACHSLVSIFEPDGIFQSAPENIERLIHTFPGEIAFSTNTGYRGIMALNKAGSHNIHTLGLVERNQREFFQHDLSHSAHGKYPPSPEFYNTLRKKTEKLPIQKRKHIELSYWILTYENDSSLLRWFLSPAIAQQALAEIFNRFIFDYNLSGYNELKGLIDMPNKTSFQENTKQVTADFYDFLLREPQMFQDIPNKNL